MSQYSRDTLELAAQVVFDYPSWGDEHCYEMIETYQHTGEEPPCTSDELYYACQKVAAKKREGLGYMACVEAVEQEQAA